MDSAEGNPALMAVLEAQYSLTNDAIGQELQNNKKVAPKKPKSDGKPKPPPSDGTGSAPTELTSEVESEMDSVLDIQRDHGDMIRATMAKLAPEGTLIFSNNFRKFKMDELTLRQFDCENITPKTLDVDFERNPRIHNVWVITRRTTFG